MKIHNKSIYAPLRYEATRAWDREHQLKKGLDLKNKYSYAEFLRQLQAAFSEVYPNDIWLALQESALLDVFCSFVESGKVIYDVSNILKLCLKNTDFETIRNEDIRLPNQAFYLQYNDGEFQGAFIRQIEKTLSIIIVLKDNLKSQQIENETYIPMYIDLSESDKTIAESLATLISNMDKSSDLLEKINHTPVYIEHNIDKKEEFVKASREQLSLIINSILYINARHDDVIDDWSRDVPESEINRISSIKNFVKRQQQEKTLYEKGYNKVKFIGRQYERNDGKEIKQHLDRKVAMHLRCRSSDQI